MTKCFRKGLSILLAVILLAGALPMSASAAATPFIDVSPSDWFANSVLWAVENNITGGIGNGKFGPNDPCPRAQVVTFLWAANGKPEPQSTTNPFIDVPNNAWYLKPVLWAVEHDITGGTSHNTFSPDQKCTRAQIVTFLFASVGKPSVSGSSTFADVSNSDWFAAPVIWAKENNITGGIAANLFGPMDTCTRSQVVTFLYKVYGGSTQPTPTPTVKPTQAPVVTPTPTVKPTVTPKPTATPESSKLNAEQIYAKCSSAVFYIEIYDRNYQMLSSGSGVFLSADGLAITNHHVVEDAHFAKILTTDGQIYDVAGYYDAKEDIDMALLQIDGSGFDYLEVNTDKVAGGQNIFTIGSPKGLDNTISTGIISNPKRIVDGLDYIQITAPISSGSSGGALINEQGRLIGITTATHAASDAQNINLAVPIYHMAELSDTTLKSFPLSGNPPIDYGASISFNSSLSVTKGGSGTVNITCDPGSHPYPDDVSVYFEPANEAIATAEWGDWNGWTLPLYVYGESVGTTTIVVSLLDKDDNVLAEKTLTVTVTETKKDYGASITFNSTLSVTKGGSNTVNITCTPGSYPYPDDVSVYFEPANEAIATAEWGDWNGWTLPLYVYGESVGTTTIVVSLLDKDDNVLAEKTLNVTVTAPQVTPTPQGNRGQQAFVAMRDWIKTNYNDTMDNTLIYWEGFEEDGGYYEVSLLYTPGKDYIDVNVWVEYEGEVASTYIELDPNRNDAFSSIYFYLIKNNSLNEQFVGYASINKSKLNQGYKVSFIEAEGDTANQSDYAEYLKMSSLLGLIRVDMILDKYLPQYSVADFGFTSIYT